MKKQDADFFTINSQLSIEFSKYVLDHPEMDELLLDEVTLVFLPEFNSELRDFNLKIAEEIEKEGGKVAYVKVKEMAERVSSRLLGVELETRSRAMSK
jgi:hypothetical protein